MLEKNYLWRIYWRLAGVIMVCVVIALAVVSYFSHRVFERELVPETEQKAATVGASVRALVLKATGYGIEFAQLYGVEQTFAEVFEENPEFAYMAITNTDGNVLFARGSEPIGARTHFRNPVVLQIAHETTEMSKAARAGEHYTVSLPTYSAGNPLAVRPGGVSPSCGGPRAGRGAATGGEGARADRQAPPLRLRAPGGRGRRDEPEPHRRPALRLHPRRGAHALLPADLREPAAGDDPRHLAAGRDRAADHALHADRRPRAAVPRRLEREGRAPQGDAGGRHDRDRGIRRHRARLQPLRPAVVAIAVRAGLRDGVRRRPGLRAGPYGSTEPGPGIRALHRPDHAGPRLRAFDRRHPRGQHRLPHVLRRLGGDGRAVDPRHRAAADGGGAPHGDQALAGAAHARSDRVGPEQALHDAHRTRRDAGQDHPHGRVLLPRAALHRLDRQHLGHGRTHADGLRGDDGADRAALGEPVGRDHAARPLRLRRAHHLGDERAAAAALGQLPRALRRGVPPGPRTGAVDRGAERARGRALPGRDPHLRPRRRLRRLSPPRAPRQRPRPAHRELAGNLLGLSG